MWYHFDLDEYAYRNQATADQEWISYKATGDLKLTIRIHNLRRRVRVDLVICDDEKTQNTASFPSIDPYTIVVKGNWFGIKLVRRGSQLKYPSQYQFKFSRTDHVNDAVAVIAAEGVKIESRNDHSSQQTSSQPFYQSQMDSEPQYFTQPCQPFATSIPIASSQAEPSYSQSHLPSHSFSLSQSQSQSQSSPDSQSQVLSSGTPTTPPSTQPRPKLVAASPKTPPSPAYPLISHSVPQLTNEQLKAHIGKVIQNEQFWDFVDKVDEIWSDMAAGI